MIKAVILDVDGVLVGEKTGYNFPHPHQAVIARLKSIEQQGVFISLCTAKPYYAIEWIIEAAGLRNLHITEGGAVIIDPLDEHTLKTHYIDPELALQVSQAYLTASVYTEAYSLEDYFLQKDQQNQLTGVHAEVLQRPPILTDSLAKTVADNSIVKLMPVARDEADKAAVNAVFEPFKDELTLNWTVHPIALPHQFAVITTKGISKQQAALAIARHHDITPAELLGVGDSTSDWRFIEQCGYAATLANGTRELKALITAKASQSHIGGSVDENGVLDVFDYFGL